MSEEEKKTKSTGEMVTDNALKLQKAVLRQKIMIGALVGVIAVGGAGAAGYKLGWFGGDNDKHRRSRYQRILIQMQGLGRNYPGGPERRSQCGEYRITGIS